MPSQIIDTSTGTFVIEMIDHETNPSKYWDSIIFPET